MTDDDILVRLRRNAECWIPTPEAARICLEAADEIERLRRELARERRGLESAVQNFRWAWYLYRNKPKWRWPWEALK